MDMDLEDPATILIVEKHVQVYNVIQSMLRLAGMSLDCVHVRDGSQAYTELTEKLKNCVLILASEETVPMSGIQFLRYLRLDKEYDETPFILMMAQVTVETVKEVKNFSNASVITKPFNTATLSTHLTELGLL